MVFIRPSSPSSAKWCRSRGLRRRSRRTRRDRTRDAVDGSSELNADVDVFGPRRLELGDRPVEFVDADDVVFPALLEKPDPWAAGPLEERSSFSPVRARSKRSRTTEPVHPGSPCSASRHVGAMRASRHSGRTGDIGHAASKASSKTARSVARPQDHRRSTAHRLKSRGGSARTAPEPLAGTKIAIVGTLPLEHRLVSEVWSAMAAACRDRVATARLVRPTPLPTVFRAALRIVRRDRPRGRMSTSRASCV